MSADSALSQYRWLGDTGIATYMHEIESAFERALEQKGHGHARVILLWIVSYRKTRNSHSIESHNRNLTYGIANDVLYQKIT